MSAGTRRRGWRGKSVRRGQVRNAFSAQLGERLHERDVLADDGLDHLDELLEGHFRRQGGEVGAGVFGQAVGRGDGGGGEGDGLPALLKVKVAELGDILGAGARHVHEPVAGLGMDVLGDHRFTEKLLLEHAHDQMAVI